MIDIILISDARRGDGKQLTINCIWSINRAINATASNKLLFPNIIVVESDPNTEWNDFKNITSSVAKITTIHPKVPFNYNRYLNIGIAAGKAEYIAMCNNDLEFEKYWAENIVHAMTQASTKLKEEILSASPYCPVSHSSLIGFQKDQYLVGYKIRENISGWCIFVKRSIFEKIGKLNEEVDFWFSDNIYADQLRAAGLKHILSTRSMVLHIDGGSNTLKTVGEEVQNKLTTGQSEKYHKAKTKFVTEEKTEEPKNKEPEVRTEYNPPVNTNITAPHKDPRYN